MLNSLLGWVRFVTCNVIQHEAKCDIDYYNEKFFQNCHAHANTYTPIDNVESVVVDKDHASRVNDPGEDQGKRENNCERDAAFFRRYMRRIWDRQEEYYGDANKCTEEQ